MFPVIDFRNGRYQGQTKNQLPHGLGCFMDSNFLFVIGEWIAGEVIGHAIVFFPTGRIFCGRISYRNMEGICLFQFAEDHVQLVMYPKGKKDRGTAKIAALLPYLKIVLDIDNSNPEKARVLNQYDFSTRREEQNANTVAKILNLDRNQTKRLLSYRNLLQYFEDNFAKPYPNVFEYLISTINGRKQYYLGLKGEGLGLNIYLNDEPNSEVKKTGRVYMLKGMGSFTKQNQLRDLGIKMKENTMKGVIFEEGVFSLSTTIISYESGKRPVNCSINFHNYIKRSLFYRDKVLDTQYLYALESDVYGFNENLRKIETQKLAQITIENPNSDGNNLSEIERNRREKVKYSQLAYKSKQTVFQPQEQNPYSLVGKRVANPEYNLGLMKDDIYRTANKKAELSNQSLRDYKNVEYVDPKYRKVEKCYGFVPVRDQYALRRKRYMDYDDERSGSPNKEEQVERVSPYRNQQAQQISPVRGRQLPNKPQRYDSYQHQKYPQSLYPNRTQSPNRNYELSPSTATYPWQRNEILPYRNYPTHQSSRRGWDYY